MKMDIYMNALLENIRNDSTKPAISAGPERHQAYSNVLGKLPHAAHVMGVIQSRQYYLIPLVSAAVSEYTIACR